MHFCKKGLLFPQNHCATFHLFFKLLYFTTGLWYLIFNIVVYTNSGVVDMKLQDHLIESMEELNEDAVLKDVRVLIDMGNTYNGIIMCLNIGINMVGRHFESGEYFIADLIVSGMIYRSALALLKPLYPAQQAIPVGRILIGVVEGDIHDVGKDIVVDLLRAERFDVIDLGVDVKPDRFVYAVKTYKPDILLLSGVLSLSRDSMKKIIRQIEEAELRDRVKIVVGGICANEILRKETGADAWAYDTMDTLSFCKKIIREKYYETKE